MKEKDDRTEVLSTCSTAFSACENGGFRKLNAFQSGGFRKRRFRVYVWTGENEGFRKR